MKSEILIQDKEFQASGYPTIVVRVEPAPGTYHQVERYDPNTNNTSDEVIWDDILRKYSGAWKRLADM